MGDVNVDNLKKGMIIAEDLKDSRGRFLFRNGEVIEEKHIRIMKIWGITSVNVKGITQKDIEQDELTAFDPVLIEKAKNYVAGLFQNSKKPHDALVELKRLTLLRSVEKLSKGIALHEIQPKEKTGFTPLMTYADMTVENKLSISELVDKNVQLSSFPDIYHQIMNLLNDTRSSAVRIAEVVSKDTGLSASILKLVNSAFYGLPARVDSISRAISLIGGKELSSLAMGISVIRYFKDIPHELVDMKQFWLHSIACGVFARILANRKVDWAEEQYFIGGLLHDIGRLILFKALPKTTTQTIRLSIEKGIPLFEAEKEILGYDHSEVAGLMLNRWNFPKSLHTMIRYHHAPLLSKSPIEPSIIYVSNILAKAFKFGNSGNMIIPPFSGEAWDVLELPVSILSHAIQQADRQVNEILRAFHLHE